jgi:isoquinoline 1-oxidoreductase beta subunit
MYDVPTVRTVAWRTPLPFPTGWWRGLGLLANVFAIESFMDEMAHAADVDPLEFRLRHLPDGERGRRIRTVLETVAAQSQWGTPSPAGRAKGLAVSIDANTVVAQVAEVSVTDGKPRVHNVWCTVDCGLPINPDGVSAQTQGSIIMGLSSTLIEEVIIEEGRIKPTNFNNYPLITMRETPNIDVQIVRSGDEPYGMGEPPMGPVGAAVANAIFNLTGTRLRELPLRMAA